MSDRLTVTQFIEVVNSVFHEIDTVTVVGEVAEYKVSQGKWVRFKLKDEESTIDCFIPIWNLKVPVEDGMMLQATGVAKLLSWGSFSFNLVAVRPEGEGSLKRAFELLQKKLTEEGLFRAERKRELPRFPEHIALVTSPEAAAYTDFLKVLAARRGGLTISVAPSQVQGEAAPAQLVQALEMVNTELSQVDVVVMVRGGGSFEDLQAFNDERVVRAVAASRVPTIVGVGHERDITLAELAADVRASTPSNAAELLVETRVELQGQVRYFQNQLVGGVDRAASRHRQTIQHLAYGLTSQLQTAMGRVDDKISAMGRIHSRVQDRIGAERQRLAAMLRILKSLSPENVLRRGYSITRNQKGKVVTEAGEVRLETEVITTLHNGSFRSRITQIDS